MANQKPSNKTTYWIIGGIIVLALFGFGGYKLWHHFNKGTATQYNNTTSTGTIQNQPSSAQNQKTQTGTSGSSGLPNKTDTSNQQLDQDTQNIQNSLNQLQQDQGTANSDSNNQSQDVPQQQ